MKIALDISQAVYGTGVSRYSLGLAKGLAQKLGQDNLTLFAFTLRKRSFFTQLSKELGVELKLFSLPPSLMPQLSTFPISWDKLLGTPDLVHTSDWAELKTSCPKVTTVHDLVFKLYPETLAPSICRAQTIRLKRIITNHTHIIADSQSTARDLSRLFLFDSSRVDVVYPGLNQAITRPNNKEIERVKKVYQLTKPYLLSVATKEPRKNLALTLKAHQTLSSQPGWEGLELALVGKAGWGGSLTFHEGVRTLGFVPDKDLSGLYAGASVFVYPSLYEGFGYPVLEAMACGVPVVTSLGSSLEEIAQDSAILVDPKDELELVAGIIAARQNQAALVSRALAHAQNFTWEKAIDQIISIYEKVINENRN